MHQDDEPPKSEDKSIRVPWRQGQITVYTGNRPPTPDLPPEGRMLGSINVIEPENTDDTLPPAPCLPPHPKQRH